MIRVKLFFIFLLSFYVKAQIGIGGESFSPSEVLNIESSNRGLLLPKLYMPDPLNNIAPADNPNEYMIAFNNDYEYKNENSFYYTYRKSPTQMAWRGVLDINIINSRLVPIRTYNVSSTEGVSQGVGTGGPVGYRIGEYPEDHSWVKIPGLEKTVKFGANQNETTIIVEGMAQDDNTGRELSANSYAIGLFIDGVLRTVRTYSVNSSYDAPCAYQIFNLKSNVYNLRRGYHTFSVYAITRSRLSGDASTLSFAAPNPNCGKSINGINDSMSKGYISIQIQETKEKK